MAIAELLIHLTRTLSQIWSPLNSASCDKSKFKGHFPWRSSFKDALEYAKVENRPIMVLIWMDGCPSCAELIPKISTSAELVKAATEDFSAVALNEHRDDVAKFRLDGGYTPRIYFLSPKGEVDQRFYNKWDADPGYKFFYPTVDGILKSMNEVLKAYPDRCTPSKPCKIHGGKHPK
ncbi:Thioredoxin domain containing 12 (Endoplasmic reticulum) [Nesidiocoris tenuis]|uniref:Thioredoxin domain containing 12 (Endoplasmic reticulum) n=1 Tax=Nesidiocoris tenuis TaxID=355587 RepID=A0ABN7BI37_9HEMI|nr:Thioredoxin domain containing 12 (Endoplasmic reticulum) [Nesidiocoris tenuis]